MMELDLKALNAFINLIHLHAGITMDMSRKSLIQNRLRPRLRDLNLDSYDAYLELLKTDHEEVKVFVDLLTTNETYFYRTPRIWTHIRETLLPAWFQENEGSIFYAWSGASSSGEEAYTLGIILQEFKEKNPKFHFQIVGTDISGEILKRAQEGSYLERSIDPIRAAHPHLFKKYISLVNGRYEVDEKIKAHIRFKRHNLFEALNSTENFDLVLLRNVLIYFTPPDQEKVLQLIHRRMKNRSTLVIGESESLSQVKTNFQYLEPLIYKAAA